MSECVWGEGGYDVKKRSCNAMVKRNIVLAGFKICLLSAAVSLHKF